MARIGKTITAATMIVAAAAQAAAAQVVEFSHRNAAAHYAELKIDQQHVVERTRRETCWRTNRSTGQKFKIC
jgi:hypothetical protein